MKENLKSIKSPIYKWGLVSIIAVLLIAILFTMLSTRLNITKNVISVAKAMPEETRESMQSMQENKKQKVDEQKDIEEIIIRNVYIGPEISSKKTAKLLLKEGVERDYAIGGDKIEYTILVENAGHIAKDVIIKDNIPDGTEFVLESIKVNGDSEYLLKADQEASEATVKAKDKTEDNLKEGIIVNVPASSEEEMTQEKTNGKVELSFIVKVKGLQTSESEKDIKNVATIDDEQTESNTIKEKKAQLEIAKTANPESGSNINTSEEITYTITITNQETIERTVIVKDNLPSEVTFIEGSMKINGSEDAEKDEQNLKEGIEITVPPAIENSEDGTISEGQATIEFKVNVVSTSGTITNIATMDEEPDNPLNEEKQTEPVEHTINDNDNPPTTEGKVTVHHYIYDPELPEEERYTTKQLVEDVVTQGEIGTSYTTTPSEDVPANYECKTPTPDDYEGEYAEEEKVVTYYYELTTPTIESEIQKTAVIGGAVKEGETSKVLTREDGIVTYSINYTSKITNYIGKATIQITDTLPAKIDPEAEGTDLKGGEYDGDRTITWTKEIEHIDTYANQTGSDEDGSYKDGTYTIEFAKQIKVVYVEQDTSEDLVNSITGETKVYYPDEHTTTPGEEQVTQESTDEETLSQEYEEGEVVFNNVEITKESSLEEITSSGQAIDYKITFTAQVQEYAGKVTVEIIDTLPYELNEEKMKELAQSHDIDITEQDWLKQLLKGGEYRKSEKTITWQEDLGDIDTSTDGNEIGPITKEISLIFKDIDTSQNSIKNTVTGQVKLDEEISPKVKASSEIDVNITGKVTVKYEDENGESIVDPETKKGKIGESYTTEEKAFDGYRLKEVIGDKEGEFSEEEKTVIYVYERIPAKVVVRYLEKDTEKELAPEFTIEGYVGEVYNTTRKEIDNYRSAEPEPDNATGRMKVVTDPDNPDEIIDDTIVVTYYYEKMPAGKLTVKYLDIDTGEEIKYTEEHKDGTVEEKTYGYIIEGKVGDKYKTEKFDIPYYNLFKIPENASGELTEKEDTIIYYYQKKAFNFSVEKVFKSIILNNEVKDITNNKSSKVEIVAATIPYAKLLVTYKIIVKNTGELDGKAKVIEMLPEGYELINMENYWTKTEDGNLEAILELKAGETKELEVTLQWINGESNFGIFENTAKVVDAENEANFKETSEEDNESTAELITSIKTGMAQNITLILIGTSLVITLFVLVYLYENYNKERGIRMRKITIENKRIKIKKQKLDK